MDKEKTAGSPEESAKLTTPPADVEKAVAEEEEKENPEQSKLLEGATEVIKFIKASDPKNGDAKIDIDNAQVVYSGMSKDELMKFANDPFWVRLRWFLFILFWAAWLGMLVGAIAIIVWAPKCPAAAPREWWEKGPIMPIDVDTFSADGIERPGTLQGLIAGFDTFTDLGAKALILSSILHVEEGASGPDAGVVNFKEVDPRYGTLSDFKALVAKAKSKDVKLMLTINPNHSSKKHPWFISSMKKEGLFTDYYMWVNGKTSTTPPNNWLSMNGSSAWTWSSERNQFYLHQFSENQPDFNFRDPALILAFKDVFSFWKKLGVNGFRLSGVSYLLEDESLKDEPAAPAEEQDRGTTHTDYGFYRHIYTSNLAGTVPLLAKLKAPLLTDPENKGIFAVDITGVPDTLYEYYGVSEAEDGPSDPVIELPLFDMATQLSNPTALTAKQLQLTIQQWQDTVPDNIWSNWLLPSGKDIKGNFKDIEGAFNMAMMLIEGTPITSYGASVPQGANASDLAESRHLMHGLSVARESPSILYGYANVTVIDDDVFAYTRLKSGNPGYLLLFNLGDTEKVVDGKIHPSVPNEVSVQLLSPEFKDDTIKIKSKLDSSRISVPAKCALVATFVPEKH